MKHLIYFLLFSTAVFSQNYNYAIDELQKTTLPDPPTGLVASNSTPTGVTLTWTAPTNNVVITSYKIYNNSVLLATSLGTATTYVVSGLTPETAYTFTVRATDFAGNLSADSNILTFTTSKVPAGVQNQPEEIEYFKAYLLPIAQKANLQKALDTYGSVRLEKGDYSGVKVVMHSNQSLYGHASTSGIAGITIAAGSNNVHIESIRPLGGIGLNLYFEQGLPITNCMLKTLRYTTLITVGAKLENTTIIDLQGQIQFDCSSSGYIRNTKVIKQTFGSSDILVMKGNRTTPSYGNVLIHSNYLGSVRQTTDIDNLESITMVGTDAETYGGLTRELIHINNVDKVKLFILNGGISDANSSDPYYTIDANEVYGVSANGTSFDNALYPSTIALRTNLLNFVSSNNPTRLTGIATGFYNKSYLQQINRDYLPHFNYDGTEQTATITNSPTITKLTNGILGTQYTPWVRPAYNSIPDPLGANWKTERVGKIDSTSYIQNLINTGDIAELPEGVFYISSTLNIPIGVGKGIIGSGTGKTVICGLTDDFPLISVTSGSFGSIDLSYLTLQGGSVGLYVSNHTMMMSFQSLKFVSFREQALAGVEYYNIVGLDNNFFDNIAFTNCANGIYAHPFAIPATNQIDGSTYMDKNVFYKCQFNNCSTGLNLSSSRGSNLNAWVDCKFNGGLQATNMGGELTIFANCDFTNFTGNYTLESNSFNLLNCNFYNNSNSKATLHSIINNIEGCKFLDNIDLGSPYDGNPIQNFIANSIITGNAVVVPNNIAYWPSYCTFVNCTLLSNATLSKLFSKNIRTLTTSTDTILLNSKPNPYPQFLVTQ
ncbi:fibronectin type III domain-containing protein [Flavobacterium cellulosilyticum]|uniref:Fibronectin type III domain-containing protein n=1 Tax=Flavobacterium cellulosilyticum TaxID=2541731 RepID=A0A4R5C9B6_9FLAO|nr:fibronectin type III domain-containing protein [Flavobacterium cellulosilyticum]TDD93612.1 fibronectin type III domain-containing protein [Flavobacterium cellulosilyticum]